MTAKAKPSKNKVDEKTEGFVSLHMENPGPDARTPLEGVPSGQFVKGTTVILQGKKNLISTGIILEVFPNGIRTREGIYLFK